MPNLANAKKALRQAKKRTERNMLVENEIRSLRRFLKKAIADKNVPKARELERTLVKHFDKAAEKGIIKRNTAARYKSRIVKKINALQKT